MERKYKATVTYEIWEEEHREAGETSRKGLETKLEAATLEDVIGLAMKFRGEARQDEPGEAGSLGAVLGLRSWRSKADVNFHSDEDTYYELHVRYTDDKPLSGDDFEAINKIIANGGDIDAYYSKLIDELAQTKYIHKMKHLLHDIYEVVQREGLKCSELRDASDDMYKFSMLVGPKGGREKDCVDVSVEFSESALYDGEVGGVSFRLDVHAAKGRIIHVAMPYNYTDEVWVGLDNRNAVEERWQLFEQSVDPDSVVSIIQSWLELQAQETGRITREEAVAYLRTHPGSMAEFVGLDASRVHYAAFRCRLDTRPPHSLVYPDPTGHRDPEPPASAWVRSGDTLTRTSRCYVIITAEKVAAERAALKELFADEEAEADAAANEELRKYEAAARAEPRNSEMGADVLRRLSSS